MKVSYYAAFALVALGIFVAAAPWTIAPVCEVHGMLATLANGKTLPMPCGFTARAEIGAGALLVVAGGVMLTAKSAAAKRTAGIFGIALGALAIALPTGLTKMCALADHTCRTMTQPTLIVTGIAVMAVSLGIIYTSRTEPK